MLRVRSIGCSLLGLALVCAAGCGGGGSEGAANAEPSVSGVITLDGRPLKNAVLVFTRPNSMEDETLVPVTDGQFAFPSESGQLSGEFNVRVEPLQPDFEEMTALRQSGDKSPLNKVNIPAQYQQEGELTAKLSDTRPNRLNFELWSSE